MLSDWQNVLLQYEKLVSKLNVIPYITISGGEPLLSPYLFELIESIHSMRQCEDIYLLTNGTLLNQKVVDVLKTYNVNVQISLDGASSKSHDKYRGKGTYDLIMEKAALLCKFNVLFTFQAILQKEIVSEIQEFFKVAMTMGAAAMDFTRYIPFGNYEGRNRMLKGEELRSAMLDILKYSKMYNVLTNTNQPLWCLIDENLGHPYSAGFLGLTVCSNGNIQPTSRAPVNIGNVLRNNNLLKIYLDDVTLKKLRKGVIRECLECRYFAKCRGDRNISYFLCGDLFGPDEHCWYWQNTVSKSL